jgi:hypothetical protein
LVLLRGIGDQDHVSRHLLNDLDHTLDQQPFAVGQKRFISPHTAALTAR